MAHIAHVDGELFRVRRNLDVILCEHKGALLSVQGEHGHAVSDSQHQCRLWSVDTIACRNLLVSALKKVFLRNSGSVGVLFKNTEDRADAYIHINVAGSIQWVKQQQILALWIAIGNSVNVVHFL